MYSFGNASQVPPDSYASGPAAGGAVRAGGAGRSHHAHHPRNASADGIATSSFAQPSTPAVSLTGNDALAGFLRDFGQFLKSAFDQIAALLGGGLASPDASANGSAGANGWNPNGASPNGVNSSGNAATASSTDQRSGNSYQLTPGTPLELGNGESVLLGNDGSLRVTDGDAQGGRMVMTLARDGGFAVGAAGSERTPQARPFGPALDPLLDDASRPMSASQ